MGYLAEKPGANRILQGNIPEEWKDNKYLELFLSLLKYPEIRKNISEKIDTKDFIQYWRKAKERTSSSISGIHFGHYIGACDSEGLSNLHATFLDLVVSTGCIVTRWVKGLSVMLEKIKGNINVEKLRAILLMEADYNFLNKLLIGIRLMRRLEDENKFPADLGGSRKEHDAIDIALGRKLT